MLRCAVVRFRMIGYWAYSKYLSCIGLEIYIFVGCKHLHPPRMLWFFYSFKRGSNITHACYALGK